MTYDYHGCTCYRPWNSVTPPPSCPVHTPRGWTWTTSVRTTRVCTGRHCAHDLHCNKSVSFNG